MHTILFSSSVDTIDHGPNLSIASLLEAFLDNDLIPLNRRPPHAYAYPSWLHNDQNHDLSCNLLLLLLENKRICRIVIMKVEY